MAGHAWQQQFLAGFNYWFASWMHACSAFGGVASRHTSSCGRVWHGTPCVRTTCGGGDRRTDTVSCYILVRRRVASHTASSVRRSAEFDDWRREGAHVRTCCVVPQYWRNLDATFSATDSIWEYYWPTAATVRWLSAHVSAAGVSVAWPATRFKCHLVVRSKTVCIVDSDSSVRRA